MKTATRFFIALLICCAWAFTTQAETAQTEETRWGETITLTQPVDLQTAVAQADAEGEAKVLISAEVGSVCQVKGCWLGLVDAQNNIRVTFKDYGFFVPLNLVGKTVKVQGNIRKVTMSLEDTKHYVEDAGGDPATVTEPRVEYQLVATGVELAG